MSLEKKEDDKFFWKFWSIFAILLVVLPIVLVFGGIYNFEDQIAKYIVSNFNNLYMYTLLNMGLGIVWGVSFVLFALSFF